MDPSATSSRRIIGGIAIVGALGRGKSYIAGQIAREALAAGQRVGWIWPRDSGHDAELPAEILQLNAPSFAAVQDLVAGIRLDLVVIDSAERLGVSAEHASCMSEDLAKTIRIRVVMTVAP